MNTNLVIKYILQPQCLAPPVRGRRDGDVTLTSLEDSGHQPTAKNCRDSSVCEVEWTTVLTEFHQFFLPLK